MFYEALKTLVFHPNYRQLNQSGKFETNYCSRQSPAWLPSHLNKFRIPDAIHAIYRQFLFPLKLLQHHEFAQQGFRYFR